MSSDTKARDDVEACPFCEIIAERAPASIVTEWTDAIAFRPLNPVTEGHTLVVPKEHVADYTTAPEATAAVMQRAAQLAPHIDRQSNLITSCGEAATQTVRHLHVHIVPRRLGDGLTLPWTDLAQVRREAAAEALREAADRWGDPAEVEYLKALADAKYQPGGPSMPEIWLRDRAGEQIERSGGSS